MVKNMNYYRHETSYISPKAKIGDETRIWQFCTILDNVIVGKKCNLGQNVFLEEGVVLGNVVTVKNNVALYRGVICEDEVFLGPNCVFTNVRFPRSFISRKDRIERTIIKRGATIGANATIRCGCTIGEYSMVGAGAVVIQDVNPHCLVVGDPAKKIGYVCKCGEKLQKKGKLFWCKSCMKKYQIRNDIIRAL